MPDVGSVVCVSAGSTEGVSTGVGEFVAGSLGVGAGGSGNDRMGLSSSPSSLILLSLFPVGYLASCLVLVFGLPFGWTLVRQIPGSDLFISTDLTAISAGLKDISS